MKIKQRITRTEVTLVDVEFPVYTQHDVGDERTYIVTYRYELQHAHVPTFLVTKITQTDGSFEFSQHQNMSVDEDLATSRISAATWDAAVDAFAKWAAGCIEKMRPTAAK